MGLLPATPKRVETPCGVYDGCALPSEDELCAVSIMRAADCMVSACRSVVPDVPIGKILIQRDEATALPKFSYAKLPPNVAKMHVLLLDPMLATGGSATMAIRCLVEAGVPPSNIIFINVVCCQHGLDVLHGAYPQARSSCEHPPSPLGASARVEDPPSSFGRCASSPQRSTRSSTSARTSCRGSATLATVTSAREGCPARASSRLRACARL